MFYNSDNITIIIKMWINNFNQRVRAKMPDTLPSENDIIEYIDCFRCNPKELKRLLRENRKYQNHNTKKRQIFYGYN